MAYDSGRETCTFIPFDESAEEELIELPRNPRDLKAGERLRFDAYQAAWTKCADRIEEVVSRLRAPVVANVVAEIKHSYTRILPGLPRTELPVIAVSGGPTFLSNVVQALPISEPLPQEHPGTSLAPFNMAHVIHLHPSDCTSATSSLKALVGGITPKSPNGQEGSSRRRPATSLASYDMNLVKSWYEAFRCYNDGVHLALIVVLHDFEQMDPAVFQDVFHICSRHIPQIPFIFLLSSSSNSIAAHLQSTYSRSTLALLRVSSFTVPMNVGVLEDLITKTFFDPGFDPGVMIGPTALDALYEHFARRDTSLDSVLTHIQLAFMKHFEEPLTVFVHDELLGTTSTSSAFDILSQTESFDFLDALLGRTRASLSSDDRDSWLDDSPDTLLNAVRSARERFKTSAMRTKRVYALIGRVRTWMLVQGYKTAEGGTTSGPSAVLDLMIRTLRGTVGRDVKWLATMISKLQADKLALLLVEFGTFLEEASPQVQTDEQNSTTTLDELLEQLEQSSAAQTTPSEIPTTSRTRAPAIVQLSEALSTLFKSYLEPRLVPLDSEANPLWDIWYTGSTPFPSELINPAPRAAIISALLHPHAYMARANPQSVDGAAPARVHLWELPDTSILFRRYLDAGRMINVHDWYEAFAQVVETQREKAREAREGQKEGKEKARGRGRGKGKGKNTTKDTEGGGEEVEEPDGEAWKVQVQARFIRALHELDYTGFVKHTGRKADHIMKTVFDLPE